MFANKEEVKAWLHANEEYIRYNDPTPGVEDELIEEIQEQGILVNETLAIIIMREYLLPF